MGGTENRPTWLSELIEQRRIVSAGPIPFDERKAERDAIVAAIREHPEGQRLAVMEDLPDIVWAALGAAYLAGLAVGYWKDIAEVEKYWQKEKVFVPAMQDDVRIKLQTNWKRAIKAAQVWADES